MKFPMRDCQSAVVKCKSIGEARKMSVLTRCKRPNVSLNFKIKFPMRLVKIAAAAAMTGIGRRLSPRFTLEDILSSKKRAQKIFCRKKNRRKGMSRRTARGDFRLIPLRLRVARPKRRAPRRRAARRYTVSGWRARPPRPHRRFCRRTGFESFRRCSRS